MSTPIYKLTLTETELTGLLYALGRLLAEYAKESVDPRFQTLADLERLSDECGALHYKLSATLDDGGATPPVTYAAIGHDGVHHVVLGLGATEAAALANWSERAAAAGCVPTLRYTVAVSAERAASIEAGQVTADDLVVGLREDFERWPPAKVAP